MRSCSNCKYQYENSWDDPCCLCPASYKVGAVGQEDFTMWEPKNIGTACREFFEKHTEPTTDDDKKEEKKMADFNIQNELKCAAPDKTIPFTVSSLGEKAVERLIEVKNKIDAIERFIGSTETVSPNGECPLTPNNLIHNLQMICELTDEINIGLNRIQEKL